MMNALILLLSLLSVTDVRGFGQQKSAPHMTPWGLSTEYVIESYSKQQRGKQKGPTKISGKLYGIRPFETSPMKAVPSQQVRQQRHCTFQLNAAASSDDGDAEPVRIIIAGAPASGKGTQCEMIKEQYGVVHLSTGDMLRAAVQEGTKVGKLAKEYMDSGKLVPDDVIIGVVKDRLNQKDCQQKGWLLDGFPRTQAQAKALADAGVCADCFLFLNVPDEILVERVVGRRTDPDTGKIYHLTFSPPPADVVDRLVHRSDDTEEKVKVRLQQFHSNVDAVKDSYTDISVTIDGAQAPTKVSQFIFEAIEDRLSSKKAQAA